MTDRIEKTVEINAPVERVWRALTDSTQFGAWFKARIDGPFVLGELSRGRMTYPGYEHLPWLARIVAMEAPRRFAYEWPPGCDDPQGEAAGEPWTLVEFTLEPVAEGTRLTVVESGFEALAENRRAEIMRMNDDGWDEQMGNIRAHVER